MGAGPKFNWVVLGVFVLTLVALVGAIGLGYVEGSDLAEETQKAAWKVVNSGFSGLIGLIAGKALA